MSNPTITSIKVNGEKGEKSKRVVTQTQRKSKQAENLALAEIEKAVCDWMDGKSHPLIPDQIKFQSHFGIWFPDLGESQILGFNKNSKTVYLATPEHVLGCLLDEMVNLPPLLRVTYKKSRDIVSRWRVSSNRKIKEWPKPVAFKSSEGMFFSRLPFDPIANSVPEQFPIIAEILGRMSHSDRFCQILGSCFFPKAPRKQALWLYGESNSGKSFLLNNIVTKLCGGKISTATFSGEALSGAHWKEPLIGKSLLVVNEASSRFLGSDSFKSLTGDDLHMINPKGLKMYQGHLDCRVFFSSNEAPEIANDPALKNRIVVCKMTAVMGKMIPPEILEQMIDSELPYFVAYCMEQYAQLEGNSIQSDSEELDSAIGSFEEELQYIFDCCFIADKKSTVTAFDLQARLKASHHLGPTVTLKKFREFLKNTYGITSKKTGRGNSRPYVYFGLREKLLG